MTTTSDTYIIDTHALVWYLTDDAKLSEQAASIIERSEHGDLTIAIPTIVLAELLTIVEKKRAPLAMPRVLDWMISNTGVVVYSFDLMVFAELVRIGGGLDLHDRIIAATATRYGVPVITRDPALRNAVRAVW
ncbi:MAG: PIN domain-containing protein [Dehalococcoidia bacterium]